MYVAEILVKYFHVAVQQFERDKLIVRVANLADKKQRRVAAVHDLRLPSIICTQWPLAGTGTHLASYGVQISAVSGR